MKIKEMLKVISSFQEGEIGGYTIDTDGRHNNHGICSIILRGTPGVCAYEILFEYSFDYRVHGDKLQPVKGHSLPDPEVIKEIYNLIVEKRKEDKRLEDAEAMRIAKWQEFLNTDI